MDKEKFVEILTGVGKIYDRQLDKDALVIWLSFFKDNTIEEFKQAINEHVKTSKYFPTIAEIKSKIYELNHPKEMDNTELWESLLQAVRNSSYHAEEEFKKLPPLVKEFIQSPYQLQTLAREMTSDEIHTVYKGQFMKQIEIIKQNFKEYGITGKKNLLADKGYIQLEEVID